MELRSLFWENNVKWHRNIKILRSRSEMFDLVASIDRKNSIRIQHGGGGDEEEKINLDKTNIEC